MGWLIDAMYFLLLVAAFVWTIKQIIGNKKKNKKDGK